MGVLTCTSIVTCMIQGSHVDLMIHMYDVDIISTLYGITNRALRILLTVSLPLGLALFY
jgi:hypothetical protein